MSERCSIMKQMIVSVLLALCIAGSAGAQTWSSYTAENSDLPHNEVRTICVDSFNVTWFGTPNGLTRFDGETWTTYTTEDSLADNSVNDIAYELAWGPEIWVATDNGVSVIAVTPDAITVATPYRTANQDLVSNQVNTVAVDDFHNKWFGTDAGISRFDGSEWQTYLAADIPNIKSDVVTCSAKSDSSYTLLGTTGGGVTRLDAETTATPYRTEDTAGGLLTNDILAVFVASDSTEWVGTSVGLFLHEELPGEGMWPDVGWTGFTTEDGLAGNVVRSISQDASGMMWIGTESGLSGFDGETWTTYTTADGIAGDIIYDIAFDENGTMWLATDAGVSYSDIDVAVEEPAEHPEELLLLGAFPNPFNPLTTIVFEVPSEGFASLEVYNLNGQRVRHLVNGTVSAGKHSVVWNGCDDNGNMLASGIYFSRLTMGRSIATNRMVFVK